VLEGREQIAALKAKVVVPKKSIKAVEYVEIFSDWRKWEVRMPGTYAPRLLMAGSYWTEQGWDFIYAKKPHGSIKPRLEKVLVIETSLTKYNRLIVGISKKQAQAIIDWKSN
jgi:hypothetical protein